MTVKLEPDERILREGSANLHRGWEVVGGRLYLTDRRLVFQSHAFNVQTGETEIVLADILSLRLCWTKFLGFIPIFPNSLAAKISTGDEYRLVVQGRQTWAEAIQRRIDTR